MINQMAQNRETRIRGTSVVLAALFLPTSLALGLFVIPKFKVIFAEMLPGESLPWLIQIVLRVSPIGFVIVGLVGALATAFASSVRMARIFYVLAVGLFCLMMGCTIAALFNLLVKVD